MVWYVLFKGIQCIIYYLQKITKCTACVQGSWFLGTTPNPFYKCSPPVWRWTGKSCLSLIQSYLILSSRPTTLGRRLTFGFQHTSCLGILLCTHFFVVFKYGWINTNEHTYRTKQHLYILGYFLHMGLHFSISVLIYKAK